MNENAFDGAISLSEWKWKCSACLNEHPLH